MYRESFNLILWILF